MALRKTKDKYAMLPYRKGGPIDYDSLDFAPDVWEWPPDHMEQSKEIAAVFALLNARFTDFHSRHDVFIDIGTNICYDPRDLNVRVAPDVYVAFGVDELSIRPRRIYLPWEVGKVPDWALEIASRSTRQVDLNRKPAIYARIGVPELWRFDPTGGRYYGFALNGLRLADGEYQPIELTTEPDGVLKGYSEVLGLSLAWDDGQPRFFDPATGAYLEDWRQDREALRATQGALQVERQARADAEAALESARARERELEEELRRLRGDS